MKAPLREARIIFPIAHQYTLEAYRTALADITARFGGATVFEADGHWKDDKGILQSETVYIVDVAYSQNTTTDMELFNIAMKYREEGKQQEVYLRYGNGHVQMVDIHSQMDNGRPNCWYSPDFAGSTDAINSLMDDSQTEATRLAAFQYLQKLMAVAPNIDPVTGLDWE